MARYLSRAELSCIAGKYIEMYYALFGISKNGPAPINPEQFASSVLGLNLKMLPLCNDGHSLGLTVFQRCSFTATLEDGTKLVEVFMPRDIRTIFLPKTVAEMLVQYKAEQDMTRDALGTEYADYNLVVTGLLGMPTEQSTINGALKQLIEGNDLPKVVFHSFRHSSITYKLKLNGGDIKAVQGDSGHTQASMVTEQYAHILDDDRRLNAQRFDDFFYQHQGAEPEMPHQTAQSIPENSAVDADAAAALTKLLTNPSMAELIKNLAKSL